MAKQFKKLGFKGLDVKTQNQGLLYALHNLAEWIEKQNGGTHGSSQSFTLAI